MPENNCSAYGGIMKKLLICGIVLSAFAVAGCETSPTATTATPSPTVAIATPTPMVVPLAMATPEVKSSTTKKLADGSTIVTYHHVDGSKTEVRTLPVAESAPPHGVATVTRTTSSSGEMTATVTYKDNSKAEVKDKNWVDKSMTATSKSINTATDETVSASKKAASTTESAAVTAGKATAKGATVAGEKTAEGAKTVGSATVKGAEAAGKATVEGAKKVGNVMTGKKSTPTPKPH